MNSTKFDYQQVKGTFEWDLATHEFNSSQKLNRLLGFNPQTKITYSDFIQAFHPEDKPVWDYAIKNAYPRESLKFEMRIITQDKSIRWIKFYGRMTYNDLNKIPIKIHGTVQDITELKALFFELKESEEKFRLLADSIPQQIWTSDIKGHFNYFNQAVFDYSGLGYEQMQKEGWISLVHPEDQGESIKMWAESIATGRELLIQHRLRNSNGEYRWHESRAIPQKDSLGKIQMWVGTVTDIHGKKNFVQELEKKIRIRTHSLVEENMHLAKSNNELQQFAFMASHDLQEPLRKIITFSNRIQEQYNKDMPEGSKAYLEKIISSSQRMTRLIEDLLNFSMIVGSEEQFVKTDLNDVLKLILTDFEVLIRDKDAHIQYEKLPVISANSVQMSQLFRNLIGNALKFSQEGVPPIITISARELSPGDIKKYPELHEDNTYHEITIKDNGIGFDQQNAEKIFTIFHRLNHQNKYKGTGIGLALCKKIIENHQGVINVESETGKGTSFHLILPV